MKKIFFVIWGDPKFYQTLIFLCKKLSKDGHKILIISKKHEKKNDFIKDVYLGKNVKILSTPTINFKLFNILNFIIFLISTLIYFLFNKPKRVIFFNKKALLTTLILKFFKNKNTKFIYHNFDFDIINNIQNIKERILVKLEFNLTKNCEYLVFPSKSRALIFQKNSKNFLSKYFSFMNCFPIEFKLKNSKKFDDFISSNNLISKKIVCHLGSIGPDHYIENIISSFVYVKSDIILIIAGNSISNFAKKLQKNIKKKKLEKKVFIIENVSNKYWYGILKKSSLGLCFYRPSILSHKHMAGTSQKFNNYLASNIPMIVNNNKDFMSFKKKFDIFETTNPNRPENIALSINNIFLKKKRYFTLKKNMRNAFKKKLNFRKQFDQSYYKFLL